MGVGIIEMLKIEHIEKSISSSETFDQDLDSQEEIFKGVSKID
jgi:hypothetical protein